jgi:rod shape-determining protein MreD
MKKKWYFFILILIAALLESVFLNYFKIFYVRPNLILCLVVLASLCLDIRESLLLAIFGGLLQDALTLHKFGANVLLLPLWSFLIIELSRKISIDENYMRLALILITALIHNIASGLINFYFISAIIPGGVYLRITILEPLYTAFIFVLIFRFLKPIIIK